MALISTDPSMSPIIPVGAWVFLKPFDGSIIYGKLYLIITNGYSVIRKIRPTEHPEEVRLEIIDRNNYAI